MCFIEFIGYTCGHTSVPLNRECPMTTHLHSNPCCPVPATRPFLASEMCPACARILHGRWVQILEMEHRFMHERGACDCEVRFPSLQQPRLLSAGDPSTGSFFRHADNNAPGSSQVPPLYQDSQGAGAAGVAVRLPSLYGAEWTIDHAKLHESGQCDCRVQFTTYQSPLLEEYDNELKREASEELHDVQNNKGTYTHPFPQGKGKKKDVLPPVADPIPQDRFAPGTSNQQYQTTYPQANSSLSQHTYPELRNPVLNPSPSDSFPDYARHGSTYTSAPFGIASTQPHPGPLNDQQEQKYRYTYNPDLTGATSLGMGEPARWACSPPDLYLLDAVLGPVGPSAEQQAAHPVDLQSMSIHWHQRQVPLAGLPIGAGSEGDPHTPPFAECRLSRESRMCYFRQDHQGAGGATAAPPAAATVTIESDGDSEGEGERESSFEFYNSEEDGYESDPSGKHTRSGLRRSCSTEF